MQVIDKRQANAYDRMIDASADLADLIEACKIDMDKYTHEELTIFLDSYATNVKKVL
jgi:dsDNA-binding SOS-regulon protein